MNRLIELEGLGLRAVYGLRGTEEIEQAPSILLLQIDTLLGLVERLRNAF